MELLNTAKREIITKIWPCKKYGWKTVMKRALALNFKGKRPVGWSWDDLKQNGLARCRNTSRKVERASKKLKINIMGRKTWRFFVNEDI